jgi:hypothetical protein
VNAGAIAKNEKARQSRASDDKEAFYFLLVVELPVFRYVQAMSFVDCTESHHYYILT